MNIGYAIKRIFKLDFSRSFKDVARVADKSGKSRIKIFLDMIYCGIEYGAGPLDYELFEFYDRTRAQRKTYITRGVNNALVKKLNAADKVHIFDNKPEFNEVFHKYINRGWLKTKGISFEEFEKLIENQDAIIYKPIDGTCGKGIEKLFLKDYTSKDLFEYILSKPEGIIEQIVSQHSKLSQMYPLSLNTIRIVTIKDKDEVLPLCAFWRIGKDGNYVDNLNSGGIAARLDVNTGIVDMPASDKAGKIFEKHPYSDVKIYGFQIPMWKEIIETVKGAANVLPDIRYVGWDVALSENSVQLIEGNCFPGHDILQLPSYTPNKTGFKPLVEKFL